MKNYLIVFTLLLLCITSFTSCKKEKGSREDFSTLFKNTVWTGEIKYTTGILGSLAQPYSIAFNGNGNFEWSEFGGNYEGNYTLDEGAKKITLQFTGASNAKLTVEITEAKAFGLITPAATYPWEILNGRLNEVSGQSLENTVWNGSFNSGSGLQNRQLKFLTGQQVSMFGGSSALSGTYAYVRKNGTLRFTWTSSNVKNFLVLLPDNKIKCLEQWPAGTLPGGLSVSYVYEVIKQ